MESSASIDSPEVSTNLSTALLKFVSWAELKLVMERAGRPIHRNTGGNNAKGKGQRVKKSKHNYHYAIVIVIFC